MTPSDRTGASLPAGMPPADARNPSVDEAQQIVAAQWQSLHDRLERERWPLLPLVDALMQHPRLSLLYPFTSHARLCLSRCTMYPFSMDCPHAEAVGETGERRFRVLGPRYRMVAREWVAPEEQKRHRWREADYEVRGEGDVSEALTLMESGLPPECGPAILGNEDDLRRHLGLPVQDEATRQLLFNALRDPQALRDQLAVGVSDINVTDYQGFTALMFAALGGHVEAVQLLLAHGAEVHRRTEGDETALSLARFQDDKCPEIVELLRRTGATE